MAICNMSKVRIAGHRLEYASLLQALQNSAIIEFTDIGHGHRKDTVQTTDPELRHRITRLRSLYTFISKYETPQSVIAKMFTLPPSVNSRNYETIEQDRRLHSTINTLIDIKEKLEKNEIRLNTLQHEQLILHELRNITLDPQAAGKLRHVTVRVGYLANKYTEKVHTVDECDFRIIQKNKTVSLVLLVIHAATAEQINKLLTQLQFKEVHISDKTASPHARYIENRKEIQALTRINQKLARKVEKLAPVKKQLSILIEYSLNKYDREQVQHDHVHTSNAFVIEGWVPVNRLEKITEILSDFSSVEMVLLPLTDDDSPPVNIENKKIFSPFRLLIKLYNYPRYRSLDPSVPLAIFFIVFFGLTLTDAAYGLVLLVLSLFSMVWFKKQSDILWLIMWGGLLTIAAGLVTGGILGDLFRVENPYLRETVISTLRQKTMLFDPLKNPMVFFRLVLLLGVVHIALGLAMGIFSDIKNKQYLDALADHLCWLCILSSGLLLLFSSHICIDMSLYPGDSPPLPAAVQLPSKITIIIMALVVIIFGGRKEKGLGFRIFIGFLKLFVLNGIFSYLGDILSYIRLMALGMVTAGIAMAVNTIAFMTADISVIGIFITIIILITGHLFNMCINMIGGFVHTLRLQYVEFFSKFYTAGGSPFKPFRNNEKFAQLMNK